jgi:hypothetical protein
MVLCMGAKMCPNAEPRKQQETAKKAVRARSAKTSENANGIGIEFTTTIEPAKDGDPHTARWSLRRPGVRGVSPDEVIAKHGKKRAKNFVMLLQSQLKIIRRVDR